MITNAALAAGERVHLSHPSLDDAAEFAERVRASRKLHGRWVFPPSDRDAFASYVARCESEDFEALFVRRNDNDAIAGVYNLSQIFYGSFRSAYLGYYALQPLSGQGYMREALPLVLHHAFGALGLHRLEANVQPENECSRRLVEAAGFRLEGYSPRYLHVAGRWRDHERWAITTEDLRRRRRVRPHRHGPIALAPVKSENWRVCASIEVRAEQHRFVNDVSQYLALCAYDPSWHPMTITEGGNVVGFAMWGRDPDDGSYWIGGLVVDRRHQGRGVGRAAMNEAIRFLGRKRGCREIALSYRPDNVAARTLYRSLGFVETGERDDDELVARLVLRRGR